MERLNIKHSVNGQKVVNFWQIDGPFNVQLEDGSKIKVSKKELRSIINKFYNKLAR